VKNKCLLLSVLLSTSGSLLFANKPDRKLDLEMTGTEYLQYLNTNKEVGQRISAPINNILSVGKRNLDWLKLINANRPADAQLPLVTPALQTGIPIDSPRKYNETTVVDSYDALLLEMPDAYKTILLGTDALPTNHPLATDDDYLTWLRKTNRIYESASRWTIMEPYLDYLASISYEDIRGYYFLGKVENLEEKLNGWTTLDGNAQEQYKSWLISLCHNSQIETSTCHANLDIAISHNGVLQFYKEHLKSGADMYNSFFNIPTTRTDVVWTAENPNLTLIPFTTPPNLEIKNWLADNIQDEWKWNGWQLKLDFTDVSSPNTTHVIFEAGTTPHVNDLAGSEITMDDNAPLQDYSSRWTIRHEYGHTLGFPDCYIEFYDTDEKIIINYQLDLDNIMCSRKGHVQARHYEEMKAKYFH
jgi:hypothetical protein